MKTNRANTKAVPDFAAAGLRALRRVARKLREEHSKNGLPLVFGNEDGTVRYVWVRKPKGTNRYVYFESKTVRVRGKKFFRRKRR